VRDGLSAGGRRIRTFAPPVTVSSVGAGRRSLDYDEVRHIFSRRGAYRRYKDLLVRRGALERWYDFSDKSKETALREWCAENGIELSET
jgi:hypothetical protein